jgi:hypothetical protein
MEIANIVTLVTSSLALTLSIINFYLQQIRKRDNLIWQYIGGENKFADGHSTAEYLISNIGDNQMIIRDLKVMGKIPGEDDALQVLDYKVDTVPFILKPGEAAITKIFYDTVMPLRGNKSDDSDDGSPPSVKFADVKFASLQLRVVSARGRLYVLGHALLGNGEPPIDLWEVFNLKKEYEWHGVKNIILSDRDRTVAKAD